MGNQVYPCRIVPPTKTCSRCGDLKSSDEFYRANAMRDGLHSFCKKCIISQTGAYYKKNQDKMKAWDRAHYLVRKITPEYRAMRAAAQKEKTKTDPIFRAARNIRCRLNNAMRRAGATKTNRFHDVLGCTPRQAVYHLTHGGNEIPKDKHIDHYVPVTFFDLKISDHQKVCFNWRNLQLLTQPENLVKGGRLPSDYRERLKNICDALNIPTSIFNLP